MAMIPPFATFCGYAFLIKKAIDVIMWFWVTFLRPAKDLKKFGKWAVVTGATDGIGKAIAKRIAKKGLNVVIISRTQSKLDKVAEEIRGETKAEVKTVAIDYSKFDKDSQDKMMAEIGDLEIGILVNNVGLSYPYPQWYDETDLARLENICDINNKSMVAMTRLLVPGMLERKRGAVVNLSSAGAIVPQQLMAVYGASKAFVNNFTDNMQAELGGKGITFSCQMPMFVVSNMSKIRRSSMTVPTADGYAVPAVAHIGHAGTTSPHWAHSIMLGLAGHIPWAVSCPIIMNMHVDTRRRALRKAKRQAEEAGKKKN